MVHPPKRLAFSMIFKAHRPWQITEMKLIEIFGEVYNPQFASIKTFFVPNVSTRIFPTSFLIIQR